MKADHEDLLHHQMALVRRTYPQMMTTHHQGGDTYNVTLSPVTDAGGGSEHAVGTDTQTTPIFVVTRTDSDGSLLSAATKGGSVTCEDSVIMSATVSTPHDAANQIISGGVSERTEDVSVTTSAVDSDVTIVVSSATSCKHDTQQTANCVILHPQMAGTVLPSNEYTQLLENNCDKKRGLVDDPTSNGPTHDTKRQRDDAAL